MKVLYNACTVVKTHHPAVSRFSLTLLLHQMEQTLGEGLARLGGAALQGEEEERKERGAGLEETVTQLQRKLRQSEETHRIELQESKVGEEGGREEGGAGEGRAGGEAGQEEGGAGGEAGQEEGGAGGGWGRRRAGRRRVG